MTNEKFSVDDRGNIAQFYEEMEDGTWEPGAVLDREVGAGANKLSWDNWSSEELENWANENGYRDEILEAKKSQEGEG